MLDIRTLLLGTPEDCYVPTIVMRAAERLLFPLLARPDRAPVMPSVRHAASEEVLH